MPNLAGVYLLSGNIFLLAWYGLLRGRIMSILTADYSEVIAERKARSDAAKLDRPNSGTKARKFRDIENIMFIREMKSLKRANIEIG